MEAQALIERIFGIALNPNESYSAQLNENLASSGDLSSKQRTNELLFELCQLVDKQQTRIKALEDDRVEIASQMLNLRGNNLDPTKPLDAISTEQSAG